VRSVVSHRFGDYELPEVRDLGDGTILIRFTDDEDSPEIVGPRYAVARWLQAALADVDALPHHTVCDGSHYPADAA
jgi:hypothetical protein